MWRHVIISTRRSWLHGDQRGFRDRDHRLHSTGDYENPPSEEEHADTRDYFKKRSKGTAIKIPFRLRSEMGKALLRSAVEEDYRVLTIAVSQKHAHLLVELPQDRKEAKKVIGRWKTARTKKLRKKFTGSIWGEGSKYKPVRTSKYHRRVFKYVSEEQGPRAWSWNYVQGTPLGAKPRHKKRKE